MIAYCITNTINNKKYIGITSKTVAERYKQHRRHARSGSKYPVHCAMRKYGETAFRVEVVAKAASWGELCEAEKRLITENNCMAPFGYNLTLGGEGILGYRYTNEQRAKISAALRGKPNAKVAESNRRRVHSAKSRAKKSARLKEVWASRSASFRARFSEMRKGNKYGKRIEVEIDGECKSLKEWAEVARLSVSAVHRRYYAGKRGTDLLGPNARPTTEVYISGEVHNLYEWSKISGVPYNAIKKRYGAGKRGAELLAPSRRPNHG